MKRTLRYISLFSMAIGFMLTLAAQVCTHTRLSRHYNFTTQRKVLHNTKEEIDSLSITIILTTKKKNIAQQTIEVQTEVLFATDFTNCMSVRSRQTGHNIKRPVHDNDYGDLVVADFNFDGKDDLAIKYDQSPTNGTRYCFYLQKRNGRLALDTFLTNNLQYFPTAFYRKSRMLMSTVLVGACGVVQYFYALHPRTGLWFLKRKKKRGRCG